MQNLYLQAHPQPNLRLCKLTTPVTETIIKIIVSSSGIRVAGSLQ